MSVFVDSADDVLAVPESLLTVSPELALVDPELAAFARVRLREPTVTRRPARADASGLDDTNRHKIAALAAAAAASGDLDAPERRRSWRLPVGVAAVTMLALLFVDVRIQVGENPASAEPPASEGELPRPNSTRPVAPALAEPKPSRTSGSISGSPLEKLTERRFAWAPVPGASGYRVEFYRGPRRILAANTRRPVLTVPPTWRSSGAEQSLRPGRYRWYVWPVVSGRRASGALVQATLSIPQS